MSATGIFCGMCNDTGLQNGNKCPQPGCRKANGLPPFNRVFEWCGVSMPASLQASLDRYAEEHVETGGFLKAVLENDCCEAVCRADEFNFQFLPVIVRYVYNELPSPCWGNKEKVAAWLKKAVAA